MSTTYYMRLKDDHKLDIVRELIKQSEVLINGVLENLAENLNKMVTDVTNPIIDVDNFNKQFCNAASWYGSYPDEPEDYHLKKVYLSELEHIQVEIGTYSNGKFNWKLTSIPEGYYDVELYDLNQYDYLKYHKEKRDFDFPRDKTQFKDFMKKYKDKVEIVDEYNDVYTLTAFLKKVDEYNN